MNTITRGSTFRIPTLDEIVESPDLGNAFQPIVDHQTGSIYGVESLLRFRTGNPILGAPFLFEYARKKQRTADLELAGARNTFREAALLPSHIRIFMNTDPLVLEDSNRWADTILELAGAHTIDPSRIVIEITEQNSIPPTALESGAVTRLREAGVQFAFDDVGVAYSHLSWIDQFQPAFLKISQDFGTAFETDPTRTKVIHNIASLAADFDCSVILEGIETRATSDAAKKLGIRFGQGYYYGRPVPADELVGGTTEN